MAKRRRLDPTAFLSAQATAEDAPTGAFPTALEADLSRAKGLGRSMGPPIAQAAGEAAAQAALGELAATIEAAREEGRLVLRIPLEAIEEGHLARDRLQADLSRAKGPAPEGPGPGDATGPARPTRDGEAMADLKASLRARGQQTPIEVVELAPGSEGAPRWGLISGWRRVAALRALRAEAGGDGERFATALALVRRPATAAEAYVAMVEENEVRQNLSFWERARIVRRAVGEGAFADEGEALRALFASASYARRSKIKSFLPVVAALEGVLRHPEAIGERLGLALARILDADPGFAGWLAQVLAHAAPAPGSEPDLVADLVAAYEDQKAERQGLLLGRPALGPAGSGATDAATGAPLPAGPGPFARERSGRRGPRGGDSDWLPVRDGLSLRVRRGRIEIAGPQATPDLAERLQAWLRRRG